MLQDIQQEQGVSVCRLSSEFRMLKLLRIERGLNAWQESLPQEFRLQLVLARSRKP